MKKIILLMLCLSMVSCIYYRGDDDYEYNSYYEPITEDRTTFNNRIRLKAATPQVQAGKIYIKDNYLFIIDPGLGFHIYDNTDRNTPINIAFIEVMGITDLSIKGDLIYVHHLQDLAIIRYSPTQSQITLINIVPDVFPKLESPDGFEGDFFTIPDNHVIIGYQEI